VLHMQKKNEKTY